MLVDMNGESFGKPRNYTETVPGGSRMDRLHYPAEKTKDERDLSRSEQVGAQGERVITVEKCNRREHWILTVTVDTVTGGKSTVESERSPCDCTV